jgi:uncharacterized HAD superfamily protein
MRVFVATYILVLILFSLFLAQSDAASVPDFTYNHNSITIPELKEKVDFKVITPKKSPRSWTLEIKTYPWGDKENIHRIRLHFIDEHDKYLIVGLEQRKNINTVNDREAC